MQLLILIGLSATLILSSHSEGQQWKVYVKNNIAAKKGSSLTIDCTFKYPTKQKTEDVQIYWKTAGTSACLDKCLGKGGKDAFIFHPNSTCVIPKYKGKTELIGDKAAGNCSLLIKELMDSQLEIYLRVVGFNDCYSFVKHPISISVNGVAPPTLKADLQTFLMTTIEPVTSISSNDPPRIPNLHLVISIPLAALLVIVVTGIIICAKHKRSQTFTREESGYYVNFSRASSNPPHSETSCKTLDMQHPEPKVIEEPVYINTEMSTNPMGQRMDRTDDIYANVDYST